MDFKKYLPHGIAVVLLLALSAIFFYPNAFSGKVLPQPDNDKARGMQGEIRKYLAKGEEAPLWTNSAFGGMPSYQILSPMKGNLTRPVYRTFFLYNDYTSVWAQVFAAMFCMYLFLSVLRVDWRVGVFGALAFGITSYNVDLLEAGHSTKMAALAFTPGVFAGALLAGRGRWLLGAGVIGLFTAMQVLANHIQITYYTLLLVGVYFAARFVESILQGKLADWAKAAVASGLAVALGFAANYSILATTMEYSKETIRGRSELTARNATRGSNGDGLDPEYAFGWSYGKMETMTLIAPRAYGGGANDRIEGTKLLEKVTQGASPSEKKRMMQQLGGLYYHGDQPFVGTAIYFGAVVCLLFFMGAFLVDGSVKWWLVSGAFLSISIAWGRNFFLNQLFFDYLPMFNKFRSVSMALGLAQLCFAALAALGLQAFFNADISRERKQKALLYGFGIIALLCMVAAFLTNGEGPNDKEFAKSNPTLLPLIMEDRAAMARSDAFRSLGFILAAVGVLWFALQGRLKAWMGVAAIALLALIDHWGICARTLTADNFESPREVLTAPTPTEYDKKILADTDPHFRVLDLSRGAITSNWTASYFHKSLSGYHAAKLQRYQEVVDTFLGNKLGENLDLIGMFNGKYIITSKGDVAPNPDVCGNAWFVKHVDIVPNADAEFQALHRLNPKDSAVVQEKYAAALQGFTPQFDSTATIKLTSYHPDRMSYEYTAKSDQVALFSEMYYPPEKGWKCYLDGQPTADMFKANYLIRGMRLPAGQNRKLEMRFEPEAYYKGENYARIASGLVLLLFVVSLALRFRQGGLEAQDPLADNAAPEEKPVAKKPEIKRK
jgi:hypothetical protein